MYVYERFDIIEVAKRCGLVMKPNQLEGVEMSAQCPFCGDNKYHLGLNRVKEKFHCFRCDEKGNSVSLYAKIFGISNKDAYRELMNRNICRTSERVTHIQKMQNPIQSLSCRHNAYYDFLQLLHLSEKHRQNLLNRGLEFHHISQFMYRSMPLNPSIRQSVMRTLSKKHNLKGIPGFFQDDFGNWQMYTQKSDGLLIPVCDSLGYIQGLQIRLDADGDRKYRWFSSNNYENGTKALPWIHVVGDTSSKVAILIEGPLKADVCSVLSGGSLFIAVPGVNAISLLPDTLSKLQISQIEEAYDMDKKTNIHVKRALINLYSELQQLGIQYTSCDWNPAYKGMDDFYLSIKNSVAA